MGIRENRPREAVKHSLLRRDMAKKKCKKNGRRGISLQLIWAGAHPKDIQFLLIECYVRAVKTEIHRVG